MDDLDVEFKLADKVPDWIELKAFLKLHAVIRRQGVGEIKTYCTRCEKLVSFRLIDTRGSFTWLCACGCSIFKYHDADKFHDEPYYTKNFIPKQLFDREFKRKDLFEKQGFKKIVKKNGDSKYVR